MRVLLSTRARTCAAGLAACGLLSASAWAQEPAAPANPQSPSATSDDEDPADVQDKADVQKDDDEDEISSDDGAPAGSAPELAPPSGEESEPAPRPAPAATEPNAQPAAADADRNPDNADTDRTDVRATRQRMREDRRENASDRSQDRRDDRADRRNRRGSPDIGLTFNAGASGALVIDQVGPRYFRDAGFRRGDRILSANGRRFNDSADFYVWLETVPVGERVPIVVLRDGRETTVYWTPTAEFVEMFAQQAPAGTIHFLGIHIDEQVDNAVVVAQVDRDSSANRAGVRSGDLVIAVNNQEVRSPREFADAIAAVAPNQPVHMALSRTFDVQLDPRTPTSTETRTSEPPRPAPAVIEQPAQRPAVIPQSRVRDDNRYLRRGFFRRGR